MSLMILNPEPGLALAALKTFLLHFVLNGGAGCAVNTYQGVVHSLPEAFILARDGNGTLCKMLNIRQLSSLLACATILWTSVVPVEAKTRKGDKFYGAGRKAELGRDFEKSLEQYEQALKEDPTDTAYQMAVRRARFAAAAARIDRAQKAREAGKVEEALLEFERAFLIDPSSSLAVQEIKRTKAMLDYQKRQGAAMKLDEIGQTPAQVARKRNEEKIGTISRCRS